MKKDKYLDTFIFKDLTNINTGFDAPCIKYFSETDFEIVLNRIKELGLGIYGIEPWKNGEYFETDLPDDYKAKPNDPDWYFKSFQKFKDTGEILQYSATYYIPKKMLKY